MSNLTSVGISSGVPNSGTGTVSTLDNLIGTAGTPSAQVQSVQGVSGGTALPVSAASLPLPTGAALESGGNLASIVTKLTSLVTGTVLAAGTALVGIFKIGDGTNTVAVKAASTAPVATDPALVVAISPNSVNANGQAVMASSAPVVIASNQTAIPANLAPATSGGLTKSRTLIPNNTTAIIVKASAGQVYKIRATNNSSTIAYIKLYDATTATAGSGTPIDTIMIPAATAGGAGILDGTDIGWVHATGIAYIVTTGIADADTTAPAASAYIVTVSYK